jgi:hypothetical protein
MSIPVKPAFTRRQERVGDVNFSFDKDMSSGDTVAYASSGSAGARVERAAFYRMVYDLDRGYESIGVLAGTRDGQGIIFSRYVPYDRLIRLRDRVTILGGFRNSPFPGLLRQGYTVFADVHTHPSQRRESFSRDVDCIDHSMNKGGPSKTDVNASRHLAETFKDIERKYGGRLEYYPGIMTIYGLKSAQEGAHSLQVVSMFDSDLREPMKNPMTLSVVGDAGYRPTLYERLRKLAQGARHALGIDWLMSDAHAAYLRATRLLERVLDAVNPQRIRKGQAGVYAAPSQNKKEEA